MLSIDLNKAFYLTLPPLRRHDACGASLHLWLLSASVSLLDPARGLQGEPLITFYQAAQSTEVLQETSQGEDGHQREKENGNDDVMQWEYWENIPPILRQMWGGAKLLMSEIQDSVELLRGPFHYYRN